MIFLSCNEKQKSYQTRPSEALLVLMTFGVLNSQPSVSSLPSNPLPFPHISFVAPSSRDPFSTSSSRLLVQHVVYFHIPQDSPLSVLIHRSNNTRLKDSYHVVIVNKKCPSFSSICHYNKSRINFDFSCPAEQL